MNRFRKFLERKDIVFSGKRYCNDALSAMATGLFSSLIIGLIIKTLGEQTAVFAGDNWASTMLVELGTTAMGLMGAAIGAAVAHGLKAPPLIVFSSIVTGTLGATLGGPAGAFLAAGVGAEFGKAVSKETKVDIIVTPAVTLFAGMAAAQLFGPGVAALMGGLGKVIMSATELQPFFMGIIVSVIMGLALTAPISSAALAIMLNLSGLAAGAATVGCCAQMVGFAVISYRENGVGGLIAQGLGTSMLQVSNIVNNPKILIPPTLTAAILGPLSTLVFHMTNLPAGAGMGTSGLVGQIFTFTDMGGGAGVWAAVLILHFLLPALLCLGIDWGMRKAGQICPQDYRLEL